MEDLGRSGAHILVFPYPAQGHIIPLLDLVHKLAAGGRLTLTVLLTPKNLPLLNPDHLPSSVHTLVLPFPPHPSIPPGVENTKDLPPGGFLPMMSALSSLRPALLRWFRSHPSPPSAILSDMFLGWTHRLASDLGIPRFVFSPSGAMALSVIYSLWRDLPKLDDPDDQSRPISFPRIPNSPSYPWWQLSPIYRSYAAGGPFSEFTKDGFVANMESWGLVINTFSELEWAYLDHLKKELGHNRVWAIGPVLPTRPIERGGSGSSSVLAADINSWLDRCQDHTVVYVCFGSQAVLRNDQMEQLANGLEGSGARFLWCVKDAVEGHVAGEYGAVPSGFEDRVAGRGLVVRGWAPQVAILRHRAVGAFLTHCGWNSTLEAVLAGVPLLAWPMGADQFINATLLVDQIGVASWVCEGAGTVPRADELAQAVAESVEEDWSCRARAAELQKAALRAIEDGGSSCRDIDGLVRHFEEFQMKVIGAQNDPI